MKNQLLIVASVAAVVLSAAVAEEQQGQAEALPEGVRGFSGRVRGVVKSKEEDVRILFKVARVLDVWDGSKAREPELLAGKTVRVGPGGRKEESGEWHPAEAQLAFIRKLQPGQELNLDVQNQEGDAFVILELSEDQRAAVREEGGKPRELRRPEERNRPERMEREVREKDILIDVLRDEIRRLYQENAELRRQLEERERRSEGGD